jgi:hypothetical protein
MSDIEFRLVRVSNCNPESENLVVTDLFREGQTAHREGRTLLGAVRWAKSVKAVSQPAVLALGE